MPTNVGKGGASVRGEGLGDNATPSMIVANLYSTLTEDESPCHPKIEHLGIISQIRNLLQIRCIRHRSSRWIWRSMRARTCPVVTST